MGRAGGSSPRLMRNSEASFTVREKPGAASRRAASLRSCTSYSFMFEPQPAALTTTASRPCPAKASMVRPASCSAVFASPACEASAPQQTRATGTTTSQPLRARARAVRRFVPRNISSWMHPVSKPTRARRVVCAGVIADSGVRRGHASPTGGQAQCSRGAIQPAREPEAPRMRQQAVEKHAAYHPVAAVLRRRLRPRHLHHGSELDARWAGGFAGAAVEALVDVRLKAWIVERHQPERRLLDLPHPPTRAVALVVQAAKRRALGEAEPAVNAVPDQVHVDAGGRRRHAVPLELRLEVERGEVRHQSTTRSRPRSGP